MKKNSTLHTQKKCIGKNSCGQMKDFDQFEEKHNTCKECRNDNAKKWYHDKKKAKDNDLYRIF